MTYKELYEKAIWLLEHNEINGKEYDKMIEPLNAEVGNAEPVRHGKWDDMGEFEQCSVCKSTHLKTIETYYGKAQWIKSPYCPQCGAKMERKEE